jgi:hypothetical protein
MRPSVRTGRHERSALPGTERRFFPLGLLGSCGWALLVVCAPPALAQVESFMLKSGSQVGPATEVKPKNCVTAQDGTITCDTELVNPAGNTPAKPHFTPFRN